MSGHNDSDWFDDFVILSMMEDEESEEQETSSGRTHVYGGSSSSANVSSGMGCSNVFILMGIIYVVLKLLAG